MMLNPNKIVLPTAADSAETLARLACPPIIGDRCGPHAVENDVASETEAADLLADIAREVCGPRGWTAKFPPMIGIGERTFRGWLSGRGEPHRDVVERAHLLLVAQRKGGSELARRVEEYLRRTT
jgi:hypothetical protein